MSFRAQETLLLLFFVVQGAFPVCARLSSDGSALDKPARKSAANAVSECVHYHPGRTYYILVDLLILFINVFLLDKTKSWTKSIFFLCSMLLPPVSVSSLCLNPFFSLPLSLSLSLSLALALSISLSLSLSLSLSIYIYIYLLSSIRSVLLLP